MAQHVTGDDHTGTGSAVEKSVAPGVTPGTAVAVSDGVQNPGMPPHRERITDLDPKKDRQAERRVVALFFLSIVGSIVAIAAYAGIPLVEGDQGSVRLSTTLLGVGIALALFGIGVGAVYWAKTLMRGDEISEMRHTTRGTDETRAKAVEVFHLGNVESGIGRRTLIRNSLIGALVAIPIPAVILFRDLGPGSDPVAALETTIWKEGTVLARDPVGTPIKASEVTLGSVFHVIPFGLDEEEDYLEEKAKAAVLLMRLKPEDLNELPERASWSYDGIVAYSKICTHVGCPVALYEQQTHHLLCPCHQSTFDVTNHCAVIFGPAKRALPQLPITVNSDGYLVAQRGFDEPVGPSYWERS
jgi:ubiquinol-cytochrome c reductase iron-sulfur subunit